MSEYSDTRNYYGKLLIIAKKPSAGRNFQKALRGSTDTFEGDPYVMISLHGHIYANAEDKLL